MNDPTPLVRASDEPGEAGYLIIDWPQIGQVLGEMCVDRGDVEGFIDFLRHDGSTSMFEIGETLQEQLAPALLAAGWNEAQWELLNSVRRHFEPF